MLVLTSALDDAATGAALLGDRGGLTPRLPIVDALLRRAAGDGLRLGGAGGQHGGGKEESDLHGGDLHDIEPAKRVRAPLDPTIWA